MFRTLILIGIGGGAGSILRFLTTVGVNRYLPSAFPWGTFAVNIVGSFLAGIVLSFASKSGEQAEQWRFLLMTGFCGGYTTFSAFTAENLTLLQSGQSFTALLYILSSVLSSLLAIWAAFLLMR
ncbi:fluoride efflux transporter CrcB [Sphingobacterium corticis]|uniref:Fluoride-specific ion channel FluC n=1 Tax=Sphingobacterium corticis TaxID=1812823 RepID=A0ABW5NMV8_9SPHI